MTEEVSPDIELLQKGIGEYCSHHCLEADLEELYNILKDELDNRILGYLGDKRMHSIMYDEDGKKSDMYVIHEILAGAFSGDAYIYHSDIPRVLECIKPIIDEWNKWLDDEEELSK